MFKVIGSSMEGVEVVISTEGAEALAEALKLAEQYALEREDDKGYRQAGTLLALVESWGVIGEMASWGEVMARGQGLTWNIAFETWREELAARIANE